MNILGVASEMVPFSKTGGLGDVMGALPESLRRRGHDIRVFTPLYDRVDTNRDLFVAVLDPFEIELGEHRYLVKVFRSAAAPSAFLVYCPALYTRGSVYTNDPDEHRRFLALVVASLTACQRMGFAPDVVHCHDWQAAMLPLLMKVRFGWDRMFDRAKTLLTVHNLNYQGGFDASTVPDLHIGGYERLLHQELLRSGRVNYMLQGILYADAVSTVSPTYAREIQTEAFGAGLDPFLRARRSSVVGILNGVDYETWSPERDHYLSVPYRVGEFDKKRANKKALLDDLGLPFVDGVPVISIVSRMASQKGFDLIPAVLPAMLARGAVQLLVLGSGEARIEATFRALASRFERQVHFARGYTELLAHRFIAGSDIFLMPSVYEPCGLTQLYALRYGTVPVVHRTGGLADTIEPYNERSQQGTGFVFENRDAAGMRWGLESAVATYRDQQAWTMLMTRGMTRDFSWQRQTRRYEQLFAHMVG